MREIRAALREVLAKWAELLTEGGLGGDLFEMHRGDLAKELAPWTGYGDKFLKALRLAYVLGTEHALAIAVKTAMGDDEDLGEWESIEISSQREEKIGLQQLRAVSYTHLTLPTKRIV